MGQPFELELLKGVHTHTHLGIEATTYAHTYVRMYSHNHCGYLMLSCLVVNWISLRVRQGIRLWVCGLFIGAYKCIRLHTTAGTHTHTHTPSDTHTRTRAMVQLYTHTHNYTCTWYTIRFFVVAAIAMAAHKAKEFLLFVQLLLLLILCYNSFFPVLMNI